MHSKVSGAYNAQETRALQSGHSHCEVGTQCGVSILNCRSLEFSWPVREVGTANHIRSHIQSFVHTRSFVRSFVRTFVPSSARTHTTTHAAHSFPVRTFVSTYNRSFVRSCSIVRSLVLRTLRTHIRSFVALRTHTTTHAVLAAVLAVLSDWLDCPLVHSQGLCYFPTSKPWSNSQHNHIITLLSNNYN